ncbi:MAG: single-stranded DNA-binding protein [Lachnospiraceae bacterium]|nr:single-stranded DNA-binding protein [Lachnospiraceae bacterium]MCR5083483.1 single-stranded DNA-binding protein [Parasporobacterium sp.]
MNKVILVGRLTRDPDIRYSSGDNGTCVARFSVAVDRRFKKDGDAQSADFPSCVAFGKTGEFIEKYVKKGTKLCIEGRLQTGSYTNKDGVKVYTTDVVVENCEFAESKAAAGGDSQVSQPAPTADIGDGFMNIPDGVDDEGLPFN